MSTTKPASRSAKRDKDDSDNPDLHLSVVGNYNLVKTVGEGNFAKVKLATHKLTGAEVCLCVWHTSITISIYNFNHVPRIQKTRLTH